MRGTVAKRLRKEVAKRMPELKAKSRAFWKSRPGSEPEVRFMTVLRRIKRLYTKGEYV